MPEADRPLRRAELADRIRQLRQERAALDRQATAEPSPPATTAAERIAKMLRDHDSQ